MSFSAFARFLPQYCLHCHALCDERLCADCQRLLRVYPRHCRCCSRVLSQGERCGKCLLQAPILDGLQIVFCFEQVVREIVLAVKYGAHRSALAFMAEAVAQLEVPAVDVLVPMPISTMRLLQRGFNQTHYLAAVLAKRQKIAFDKSLLLKERRKPQSSLAAKLRQKNIAGAFSVRTKPPKRVLLLDDVYTTGATMHEAARALKMAGAEEVFAVAFAAVRIDE